MSTETRAAIDSAVAAHMVEEQDGALATGWFVIARGIAPEDDRRVTRYSVVTDDNASWDTTAGLIRYASLYHDDDLTAQWRGHEHEFEDDDDE